MDYKHLIFDDDMEVEMKTLSCYTVNDLLNNHCIKLLYLVHRVNSIPKYNTIIKDDKIDLYFFTLQFHDLQSLNTVYEHILPLKYDFNNCEHNLILDAYKKGYYDIAMELDLIYPSIIYNNVKEEELMCISRADCIDKMLNSFEYPMCAPIKLIHKYERYDLLFYLFNKYPTYTLHYCDIKAINILESKYSRQIIVNTLCNDKNMHIPTLHCDIVDFKYDKFVWFLDLCDEYNINIDREDCFDKVCDGSLLNKMDYMVDKYGFEYKTQTFYYSSKTKSCYKSVLLKRY